MPADEDREDPVLVASVRDGDQLALEVLVRRHSPALRRMAAAILDEQGLADDVVQDTWITAMRSLDSFEGRSPVLSWLLAICANTARSRRVKERRTVPFSTTWREDRAPAVEVGLTGSGSWAVPVTEWDDKTYDAATNVELREHLERAIDSLPARQRAAVVACDVLGRSGSEAAALLGVSGARQRALLHQARCRLRLALADYQTGAVS